MGRQSCATCSMKVRPLACHIAASLAKNCTTGSTCRSKYTIISLHLHPLGPPPQCTPVTHLTTTCPNISSCSARQHNAEAVYHHSYPRLSMPRGFGTVPSYRIPQFTTNCQERPAAVHHLDMPALHRANWIHPGSSQDAGRSGQATPHHMQCACSTLRTHETHCHEDIATFSNSHSQPSPLKYRHAEPVLYLVQGLIQAFSPAAWHIATCCPSVALGGIGTCGGTAAL